MYRPSSLLVRAFVSNQYSLPHISTDSTAAVNTPTFVLLGMQDVPCSGLPRIKVLLTRADPRTKVLVVFHTFHCFSIHSSGIVNSVLIKTHTVGFLSIYIETNLSRCILYFSGEDLGNEIPEAVKLLKC